jgi:hypothetical protein
VYVPEEANAVQHKAEGRERFIDRFLLDGCCYRVRINFFVSTKSPACKR